VGVEGAEVEGESEREWVSCKKIVYEKRGIGKERQR
jgi:hypothetical protein